MPENKRKVLDRSVKKTCRWQVFSVGRRSYAPRRELSEKTPEFKGNCLTTKTFADTISKVKMAVRELATPEPPGNEPGRLTPVIGSK